MTKVEDHMMHWCLLGNPLCMLNAIQFPCLMVCSKPCLEDYTSFTPISLTHFPSDLCFQNQKFTPQSCNPIFIQSLWSTVTYIGSDVDGNPLNHFFLAISRHIYIKNPGHFGVLDTSYLDLFARVLIPGDGKLMRVQFCCETFLLLRLLLTLKQTLIIINFVFPWSFPSPLAPNSFPLEH